MNEGEKMVRSCDFVCTRASVGICSDKTETYGLSGDTGFIYKNEDFSACGLQKPRFALRLSSTIRSVVTGTLWHGPMKSRVVYGPGRMTETDSGSGSLVAATVESSLYARKLSLLLTHHDKCQT